MALEKITEAQLKQEKQYNIHATPTKFQIGSKVVLRDPTTPIGESKKLNEQYKGPFRIAQLSETSAKLAPINQPATKLIGVHLNNLKLFSTPHVPLVHMVPKKVTEPQTEKSQSNKNVVAPSDSPPQKLENVLHNLRSRTIVDKN